MADEGGTRQEPTSAPHEVERKVSGAAAENTEAELPAPPTEQVAPDVRADLSVARRPDMPSAEVSVGAYNVAESEVSASERAHADGDGVGSNADSKVAEPETSTGSATAPPEAAIDLVSAPLEQPISEDAGSEPPSPARPSDSDGVQQKATHSVSEGDEDEVSAHSTSSATQGNTIAGHDEAADPNGGEGGEALAADDAPPTHPEPEVGIPASEPQQPNEALSEAGAGLPLAADDKSVSTGDQPRAVAARTEGAAPTDRKAARASRSVLGSAPRRAVVRPSAHERPPPRITSGLALPDAYLRWNNVIAEHCLLQAGDRSDLAYLSITPRILSVALEAEAGVLLSPEDASHDFASAVAAAYRGNVLGEPDKLWALARRGANGLPDSIAFLALSVLAAYEMRSDEEAGPNAYYLRLASLLQCDLVGAHPDGFDPLDFADLWDVLSSWLDNEVDQRLALPGPDAGLRRYVAYPLGHVPLRQVDIEKLPDFFDWAGLEPGSRPGSAFLGEAFQRWASARRVISQAGASAVADDRRTAVEAQLTIELEAWDGSSTDGSGRRTAAVQIVLDFRRRQPCLFFLARRPAAFPTIFDDGSHVFESGEPGWYDPVQMTAEDGPELESGFTWVGSSPQGDVTLHRPSTNAIALRPAADVTGYLSQHGLPLGVESAVLCTAALEAPAEEFLSRVTASRCRALDHPAVPDGWRLFSRIVPRSSEPPPAGLHALAIESVATVILRGGLRLGRRAAWLAGAPPTILVGGSDGLDVAVDGTRATVRDGVLEPSSYIGVGSHVIEAGRVRRRFEIVEAVGNWGECEPLVGTEDRSIVALPPGTWTVIGSRPDEVAKVLPSDRGTLIETTFQPVWAVSVGSGPGATVLRLAERALPPTSLDIGRGRPGDTQVDWVSTIYAAHTRRPRFGWLCEPAENVDPRVDWRTYWLAARALKRRWRAAS